MDLGGEPIWKYPYHGGSRYVDLPRQRMEETDSPTTGFETRMLKATLTPDEETRADRQPDPNEEQARERWD